MSRTCCSTVLAIFLSVGLVSAAQAQAPAPPPGNAELGAWVGTWNATGTMMGMPATETVTFAWVAGGYALEGHHTASMTMPDGTAMTVESVTIWWPAADGTFNAWFFDSNGMAVQATGTTAPNTVTMSFAVPSGPSATGTVARAGEGPAAVFTFTQTITMPDGTAGDTAMVYTAAP